MEENPYKVIAEWANANLIWLANRSAEMESVETNDEILIPLRDVLRSKGEALYNSLLDLRDYAEAQVGEQALNG